MEFDYNKVPQGYVHCINRDCPLANECLRFLAAENAPEDVLQYAVLNPKAIKTAGSDCPFHRDSTPKRFGRGMNNMLQQVPSGRLKVLRAQLIALFGRTLFYEMKKGDKLVSPENQAKICEAFQSMAPGVNVEFDSYEKKTDF